MWHPLKKYKTKYLLNIMGHSPIVPFLYAQSKYIRKTMPDVPPAQEDLRGSVGNYKETMSIAYIGESTMAGVGAQSHKEGLAGQISSKLSSLYHKTVHWQVEGRIGYTKEQIVEEVLPEMDVSHANLAIIAMGGNDSFMLTPPSKWHLYTSKLIDYLKQHSQHIKICFASMPPTHQFPSFNRPMRSFIGRQTSILRASLMDTVDQYDDSVTFVDKPVNFHEYAKRGPQGTTLADLFCDGYHPSTITYNLWAEDIVEHLSSKYDTL